MDRKGYKILVVDDEQSVRLLLKRVIEDEGFMVESASNGMEALETAERFRPDLIITDWKMPVMDGMSFIKRYREKDRKTDFIVLTAYRTIDAELKSMKIGSLKYLIKPLREPGQLRYAIEEAFMKSHADH